MIRKLRMTFRGSKIRKIFQFQRNLENLQTWKKSLDHTVKQNILGALSRFDNLFFRDNIFLHSQTPDRTNLQLFYSSECKVNGQQTLVFDEAWTQVAETIVGPGVSHPEGTFEDIHKSSGHVSFLTTPRANHPILISYSDTPLSLGAPVMAPRRFG